MSDSRRIAVVSSIPPPRVPEYDKEGHARPQWADLTAVTWGVMQRYCKRHGYDFKWNISDVWMPLVSPYVDQAPSMPSSPIRYMVKFRLMHHFLKEELCLERYDWVVWVDADLLVCDMETPLTKWTNERGWAEGDDPALGDVIVPYDINALHPTVIMARSTALTRDMFWALIEAGDRLFRQHEWNDNLALRFFLDQRPYRDLFWQHSAKVLCAQHPGLYPPKSKLYEFVEGESWALHLSALSIERRIEIAKQYVERYGLL